MKVFRPIVAAMGPRLERPDAGEPFRVDVTTRAGLGIDVVPLDLHVGIPT